MNYTKPEVAVLGNAVHVVEQIPLLKGTVGFDGTRPVNPAYDLDE